MPFLTKNKTCANIFKTCLKLFKALNWDFVILDFLKPGRNPVLVSTTLSFVLV